MTVQETSCIMDILTAAYPQFYAKRNPADGEKALMLWTEMFRDDAVEFVAVAVKALIASDGGSFPPSVGAVKARIRQITTARELTEGEAWAIVSKAVKRLDWLDPEKAFRSLPEDIQRCVHSSSVLVEWGKADESAFATVIASNFQRTYRAKKAGDREYAALPGEIRAMIEQAGNGLALDGAGR